MIKAFLKLNGIIKFFICTILLIISLFLLKSSLDLSKEKNIKDNIVYKNVIEDNNEKYTIKVYYPKFNDIKIDAIIKDFVFNYIKTFKNNLENISSIQSLNINYTLYYKEDYVNIFFDIDNSLNNKDTSKNIIIDFNTQTEKLITDIYDEEYIKNSILNLVNIKYSKKVKEKVSIADINNYNYDINDERIKIYLEDYSEFNYDLEVLISLSELENDYQIESSKKKIALTFDDGPSEEITKQIVDTLIANEAKGTFFMLGYKMKNNEEIVKYVYDNNMEIGSHTYSHKSLPNLSKSKIENEINSTSILYNLITNDNIKYLRPPYGSYNDIVKKACPYPIITWSIDPKDWLSKNENKVYNHIIKRVEDGSIILLHDIYPTTLEAVKMLVPQLKSMGYELVTISELSEEKNTKLVSGKIYRKIK